MAQKDTIKSIPLMTTKREQILESALLLFSQQGVDNTSTAQIAKGAGVAKGTLFHHFENKSSLIDELFITLKHSLFVDLIESLDADEGDLFEQLKRVWCLGLKRTMMHPAELSFFTQIQNHPASAVRNNMLTETFGPFETKIIEAQKNGLLPTLPIDVIKFFTHNHFLYSASTLVDNINQLSVSSEEYIAISFSMYWNAIGGTVNNQA